MLIKMLVTRRGSEKAHGRVFHKGYLYQVSESLGAALVKDGHAVCLPPKPPRMRSLRLVIHRTSTS
jgi:hypothetical protein